MSARTNREREVPHSVAFELQSGMDGYMKGSFADLLTRCEGCPRRCGVNRLKGERGFCRIGSGIRICHAGLHLGEEPPISGTKGSGAVFFTGCNLRCVFCQNHQISQEFWQGRSRTLTTDELVSEMLCLQEEGAHNINLVSPSHVIYQIADAVRMAKAKGLAVPIVYNSNGYDSLDALRRIRGIVDVYLPDLKYMQNELGRRFSAVDNYADTIRAVIEEMLDQVGPLEVDDSGVAVRGLLVRHLVLPGHLDNSRECLHFLARLDPDISVSIMSQYSPQYRAHLHPGINRTLSQDEYEEITAYALDCGLDNAFVQELESQCHYLPDFDRERPFDRASSSAVSGAPQPAQGEGEEAGIPNVTGRGGRVFSTGREA